MKNNLLAVAAMVLVASAWLVIAFWLFSIEKTEGGEGGGGEAGLAIPDLH